MAAGWTDNFLWRIVPVGFGTAVLSGALLGLYSGFMNPFARTENLSSLELVLSTLSVSAVALSYAAVAGLPLIVIWIIALHPMKRRFGLRRGAIILSSAMAPLITLALTVFELGLNWPGFGTFVMLLIWLFATSGLAGALTYLAFRHRTEALPT